MRSRIFRTSSRSPSRLTALRSTSMRAASNCSHKLGLAGDCTRAQQRLVLPGPGLLELVLAERRERLHQQPAIAAGTQPRIDFVQAARGGVHRQQVHQALPEPLEEQTCCRSAAGPSVRCASPLESCRNTRSRSEP